MTSPSTCARKVEYPTHRAAKRSARFLRHRMGDRLRAYRCEHCGKWHLASLAGRVPWPLDKQNARS